MEDKKKNRDPVRAQKRAMADFNCSVRKLATEATEAGRPGLAKAIQRYAEEIRITVEKVRG